MNLYPHTPEMPEYEINSDVMLSILAGITIISFAIMTFLFVFKAIGLYKMAKNRGLKNSWLAFIPIASDFLMGSINDDINNAILKKSYMRFVLLGASLLTFVLIIITVPVINGVFSEIDFFSDRTYEMSDTFMNVIPLIYLISFLVSAQRIISFVVLYKIYAEYSDKNKVPFLLLSIFFNISAFFLFHIRNNSPMSLYYAEQRRSNPQYQFAGYQNQPQQPYNNQQNYNYQQNQPQQPYNNQQNYNYQQNQPQQPQPEDPQQKNN